MKHGRQSKKTGEGVLKGSESETRIPVLLGEGRILTSPNRFLDNYKAEFALKTRLICGAKLAYVRYANLFSFFFGQCFRN